MQSRLLPEVQLLQYTYYISVLIFKASSTRKQPQRAPVEKEKEKEKESESVADIIKAANDPQWSTRYSAFLQLRDKLESSHTREIAANMEQLIECFEKHLEDPHQKVI